MIEFYSNNSRGIMSKLKKKKKKNPMGQKKSLKIQQKPRSSSSNKTYRPVTIPLHIILTLRSAKT